MPGSSDVEDVLQNTNLVLWEKKDSFEIGTNFQAWAFAIARNLVKAHWKSEKRANSHRLDEKVIDTIIETWTNPERTPAEGKHQALELCMQRLKPNEIKLIEARYTATLTLEDQAGDLNRSSASVRVSLFRIREKLRLCVEKRLTLKGGLA